MVPGRRPNVLALPTRWTPGIPAGTEPTPIAHTNSSEQPHTSATPSAEGARAPSGASRGSRRARQARGRRVRIRLAPLRAEALLPPSVTACSVPNTCRSTVAGVGRWREAAGRRLVRAGMLPGVQIPSAPQEKSQVIPEGAGPCQAVRMPGVGLSRVPASMPEWTSGSRFARSATRGAGRQGLEASVVRQTMWAAGKIG
jgi:hypothetical protein